MRKLILGLAAAAIIAVPVFAGKYNKVISVGQKAPELSGIPAVMGDKDATINLKDMKEDVIVVTFIANHCPAVVATEDRVIDLAKHFQGKSVKFVGVCVNDMDSDRLPAIKARVKEKGYNFVYGYDETQKSGKAYGATNTPQFYVLDKDRVIRYTGAMDDSTFDEGKVTKTYLKDAVEALLKNESVEIAETKAVGCGIHYTK